MVIATYAGVELVVKESPAEMTPVESMFEAAIDADKRVASPFLQSIAGNVRIERRQ